MSDSPDDPHLHEFSPEYEAQHGSFADFMKPPEGVPKPLPSRIEYEGTVWPADYPSLDRLPAGLEGKVFHHPERHLIHNPVVLVPSHPLVNTNWVGRIFVTFYDTDPGAQQKLLAYQKVLQIPGSTSQDCLDKGTLCHTRILVHYLVLTSRR